MKVLKVGLAIVMMLTCTACGAEEKEEVKYMNCKRMNYFDVMDVETTIKVGYIGNEAISSETIEKMEFYQPKDVSEEEMTEIVEEIANEYKKQKEELKEDQSIDFDYEVGDTYIHTRGLIDYRKVNIKKNLKQDENLKDLLTDNKFDVNKLKVSYEALGAVCTDVELDNE